MRSVVGTRGVLGYLSEDTLTHEGFVWWIVVKEDGTKVSPELETQQQAERWAQDNKETLLRALFAQKFEKNVLQSE